MTNEEYDKDVAAHRQLVDDYIGKMVVELESRADHHDFSKQEEPERSIFMEVVPKLKGLTYGSEEYKENLKGLGTALSHHYEYNRHHPEHFQETGISQMNLIDVIEMLCDWMAATKRHADGDIQKSIEINKNRFNIDPQLVSIIKNTVDFLKNK